MIDYVEKRRESRKKDQKQKHANKQKQHPIHISDDIEEDIIQSSKEKQEDYSSEFISDHIETESIPSYKGSPLKQSKQGSSNIEESIPESIVVSKAKPFAAKMSKQLPSSESIVEDFKKS